MRMISERTAVFFSNHLGMCVAEFLDDPDGMCGNDSKAIAEHYETLQVACRDFGFDFWKVVEEENRSESEINRLMEHLAKADTGAGLMYQRGKRDGEEGLNPSSTSTEYMKGYGVGRRTRVENKLRYGESL